MRIITGLLLVIVSVLGIIFYRQPGGHSTLHALAWYGVFIILDLAGWLIVVLSFRRVTARLKEATDTAAEKLKRNAEKISLDFDSCEFRSGSYSHEISDPNLESASILAHGVTGMSLDATVTENVTQSFIVYHHQANGKNEKFISPYFPFDEITLKVQVMQHKIFLYVDLIDRSRYFFEQQE